MNKKILLLFVVTIIFNACKEPTPNNIKIIGKWKVDSIMSYYKGQSRIYVPKLDEKDIVGTIYNFRVQEFNDYGERIEYRINDYQNRMISRYELLNNENSLKLTMGTVGNENFNETIWEIENLSENSFQYSNTYDDEYLGRMVTKFYLSNFVNEKYESSDIWGHWEVLYRLNYYSGEDIKIDSSIKQMFEFSGPNLHLYYKNIDATSNYKYWIKGDSLLVEGWLDFYIHKFEDNTLILTHNNANKLFGDFSGITSYNVLVCRKYQSDF